MEIYLVGGAVRDEIMGVRSNDLDFTVVLSDGDMESDRTKAGDLREPFDVMERELRRRGFKIYPVKGAREHFTIRGQFPDYNHNLALIGNREWSKRDADFVLAREEGPYSDGRRPDWVRPGTLMMDLARRDFSMNAIAKDVDGNLIDPFNGVRDIEHRLIQAVGDPIDRFTEDALRAVRALRFSVTKGFRIDPSVEHAMQRLDILDRVEKVISDERINDELSKMFRFDTLASLAALQRFPQLTRAMFAGSVSLDSTMRTKGRGR